MLAIALPLWVGAAIAAGVWLGLWQLLALPVATLAAWLFLRLHVPAEGRIEWRVTATDVGRTHLILWSVIIGANLMMIGIQVAGFDRKNACTAGCVALLVALPPLFYRMYRADKDRQARDVQLTELALAQWDAGEDANSLRGA